LWSCVCWYLLREMEAEDLFTLIENRLYHLKAPATAAATSGGGSQDFPSSALAFTVTGIGSWIIKFHRRSIIVNDSDLVFDGVTKISATITFNQSEIFWSLLSSKNIEEDFKSVATTAAASAAAAASASSSTTAAASSFTSSSGEISSSSPSSSAAHWTGDWRTVSLLLSLLSDCHSRSASSDNWKRYSSSLSLSNRAGGSSSGGGGAVGKKSTKEKVSEGTKSIKAGWLYKKRDIMAGWRHRYFKLYVGRIEYFTDQTALVPRGVIPLFGAEVLGPKACSVNGSDDHWSITSVLSLSVSLITLSLSR
jgi:hypothetical protein